MSGIDYRSRGHDISYELPSPLEQLAAERLASEDLAQATHNPGPIDLSHVAMDEIPD